MASIEDLLSASSTVLAPTGVIMQPTTLCNLDCRYCYLPDRKEHLRMAPLVARRTAESVRAWTEAGPVDVCWHGGEPLAAGRPLLGDLMDCFAGLPVRHSVQTNATLIDDAWCTFFAERSISVGVSIDGPERDTANRVNWKGRPAFLRIRRGIQRLVESGIEVAVIAVVSDPAPGRARRLYDYATELGCVWLGVNIEEQEGVNTRPGPAPAQFANTARFWAALFDAWQANPVIKVREIDRTLGYAKQVLDHGANSAHRATIDPLPTIAWDGSVTLISPELAGFTSTRHGSFSAGNVLRDSLNDLVERGMRADWVREFRNGLRTCRDHCPYFSFCGGGHPSNRHFEHGRLDGGETTYCRNSKIALMEGMIHSAHHGQTSTR
jgi:uncharacterized protein